MSITRGIAVFSNNKYLNIKQLTTAGFLIYFTDIQMITNYRRAIKYNYRKHSQKHVSLPVQMDTYLFTRWDLSGESGPADRLTLSY